MSEPGAQRPQATLFPLLDSGRPASTADPGPNMSRAAGPVRMASESPAGSALLPTIHRVMVGDARSMNRILDSSVHLIVTSPPYWQLKDYGAAGQIGFDQGFPEYVADLNRVWRECVRVLHPGCRACVNVGDQFARASTYGRYQVLPIHAEVISGMRAAGLDYMGSIIWRKLTTCNTSGGGVVMGSYPYPRNGIIKLDYEFILIFKKPGEGPRPDPADRAASRMEAQEWNQYFTGHWNFPGVKATRHLASFPIELPRRLIKMFTFPGDTVLDPFLGSGATSAAARELMRHSLGYEINPEFASAVLSHPGLQPDLLKPCQVLLDSNPGDPFPSETSAGPRAMPGTDHEPDPGNELDASRSPGPSALEQNAGRNGRHYGSVVRKGDSRSRYGETHRVTGVESPTTLRLQNGMLINLAGVQATGASDVDAEAVTYLRSLLRPGRIVFEATPAGGDATYVGFVRLLNRTFLNGKLLQHGFARFDEATSGRLQNRLRRYELHAREQRLGIWQYETT